MIVKDKTILIMGIRNKWSIAYGVAKAAYENGAKLLFTFQGEENREKIEELISEFEGSKAYECNLSEDANIEKLCTEIKKDYDKVDEGVYKVTSYTYGLLGNKSKGTYAIIVINGKIGTQEKTEEVKTPVEKKTAKRTSSKSKKAESEVE